MTTTQITLDLSPIPLYPNPMAILKTKLQPETATQCEVCDAPLAVGEITQTCPDCGRATGLECCAVLDIDDTFICCIECDTDDLDGDEDEDEDDLDDDEDDDLDEEEDDDDAEK